MSIDISSRATAQAEGVSVDAYVERLMNEREEIVAIVERAGAKTALSPGEARGRIERDFWSRSGVMSLTVRRLLPDYWRNSTN